jgi:hypothetical protein
MAPRIADGPVPRVSKLYAGAGSLETVQGPNSATGASSPVPWSPVPAERPAGCLDWARSSWEHESAMFGAHHSVLLLT